MYIEHHSGGLARTAVAGTDLLGVECPIGQFYRVVWRRNSGDGPCVDNLPNGLHLFVLHRQYSDQHIGLGRALASLENETGDFVRVCQGSSGCWNRWNGKSIVAWLEIFYLPVAAQ